MEREDVFAEDQISVSAESDVASLVASGGGDDAVAVGY